MCRWIVSKSTFATNHDDYHDSKSLDAAAITIVQSHPRKRKKEMLQKFNAQVDQVTCLARAGKRRKRSPQGNEAVHKLLIVKHGVN